MGMEVDNTVKFTCDRCGTVRTFAVMPTLGRPLLWHRYADEFTEVDEVGNAMAGHTKRMMLCERCATEIIPQKSFNPETIITAKKYATATESDMADLPYTMIFEDLKTLAGAVLNSDPATGDE